MFFRIAEEKPRTRRHHGRYSSRLVRTLEEIEEFKEYLNAKEHKHDHKKKSNDGMNSAQLAILLTFFFPLIGAGQFYVYALVLRSAVDMLK
jgi:hypothetical protein